MFRTRVNIIRSIEAYCAAEGISERQFGIEAVGDHKLLKRLRSGAGVTLTVIEKIEAYIESGGRNQQEVA
ncbi:MAG: hypothetical protein RIB41_09975 [Oceanibaculum nanhaiense]|uniref:hypothetical protein n=1 Tax=Oceanibaculum nanhaiense TaxID=1909734 RepID=UPI0032EE1A61